MAETFVIGDIHGALKALKQVIGKINPQKDDCLIFLGDYVDGWSESAQVVDYLIELSQTYTCTFIRGNHDTWCGQWLESNLQKEDWEEGEGASTIASYEKLPTESWELHREFYNNMVLYLIDEQNRLFIHAGFASMHGPVKETYSSNYSWDRTLWELALAADPTIPQDHPFFPKRLKLFEEIYIGHTPTTNYGFITPMNKLNVWNIDTGAAFKGPISAVNVDTKEVFQSDPAYLLYPDESGRNK